MSTALRLGALRAMSAYLRVAPGHPGQWRLAQLAVRWSPLLKGLTRPVIIRVKDGFKILVDGSSQTGRIAYATGSYEPATTAALKSRLRSGETAVDVGANIGYFSLVAARAVGTSGRVVAFEPVAEVRQALAENVRINGATVEIRDEALADTTGEVRFFRGPAQDSGLGSLRPLAAGREITLRQAPFDSIWDRRSRVALVKIDVEGGELGVLRGMAETLARDRPHLLVEVTDDFLKALGASAALLWSFITSLDYEMYEIADDGRLDLVPTLEALATRPWQFNALCSPRPK